MESLNTAFSSEIDFLHPLAEYPRPQLVRKSYFSLNGPWEFSIDCSTALPTVYPQTIIVPFSVETRLSGINREVSKSDVMHYRKRFVFPDNFIVGPVILHIDAADQVTDVYFNGTKIAHHEGGYLPIETELVNPVSGENSLQIEIRDDTESPIFARGKQSNSPKGIWYHATSGIWQSVWLESVPVVHLKNVKFFPDFDGKKIAIKAFFSGVPLKAKAVISSDFGPIGETTFSLDGKASFDLSSSFLPWSPDYPFLYHVDFEVDDDKVSSYFAMRKFTRLQRGRHFVFGLNNEPLFLSGLLDQGYFPEGGLTPPSDDAMAGDVSAMKQLGFNVIRKHIKIEPLRWYYHCDRIGMLVIQDFVNGGSPYSKFLINVRPFVSFDVSDENHRLLGRGSAASRDQFFLDMFTTLDYLFNIPSICIWTLFNEGWGQFDSVKLSHELLSIDSSRLLDSTSGWYDKGSGDFNSHHVYFRKVRLRNDKKRILSLTEFGGYSLPVQGHTYSDDSFGYRSYKSAALFERDISSLYLHEVLPLICKEDLSVSILTQFCDVETEINGLLTYDRLKTKVGIGEMQSLNQVCYSAFKEKFYN